MRLTQSVQKGGCAAKVAASELRKILDGVTFPPKSEQVKVDGSSFDDAAIFEIDNNISLVQTLDFFTPIVDSPKLFGQIATANALSDVYAMGGRPQTAMAILAFPLTTMEASVVTEVLQGASDKLTEAGCSLVGGHSIDDDTLKFGLSVTGIVSNKHIWANTGAQVGDTLILTKALGTGTATAALKRSEVGESDIAAELNSMCQLNNILSCTDGIRIHAATDVTGFGLLGHAYNMAKASHVQLCFESGKVPHFERTLDFLKKAFLTKAHRTNWEYVESHIETKNLGDLHRLLMLDPQTSGGLLLSVPPDQAEILLSRIKEKFSSAEVVGRVQKQSDKFLSIEN